jgi:Winged helix DNA-binding domain
VDVAQGRLRAQRLSSAGLKTAADVVRWFGAVQAQDYSGAKWALGQRMRAATDGSVEAAFATGTILRTHLMRPTWHFVAREDIRWMLDLTAPRVRAASGSGYRHLELDDRVLRRATDVLARALEAGGPLTRSTLREALVRSRINADGQRFAYILIHAELEAVICSGPRIGKQFTYALLDERAPGARRLERDEALATLAQRYFTSHGPARLRDFTWWSGLTVADANAAVAMVRPRLRQESLDGATYWFSASAPHASRTRPTAFLLPAYDEYLVAYKDRGASLDPAVVVDGRVVGRWRRNVATRSNVLSLTFFAPRADSHEHAARQAAHRYAEFTGAPMFVTCER